MNDSSPKILIIRFSSIGDILLTTPFIRQTRHAFPNAQIDFVIKKEFSDLLKFNPNLNSLIEFQSESGIKGLNKLKDLIKKTNYDYIFDLHNNLRSNYLRLGLNAKHVYQIKKNKFIQFLLVNFKANRYKKIIPIADRYLNVGKKSGIQDDGKGLEIYWSNDTERFCQIKLNECKLNLNDLFFAVAPGAGFFTKRWPIDYYQTCIENIIQKYNCKIIVLGSEKDKQQGELLSRHENVFDCTGKFSLLQTAFLLSKSRGLISNDTGLMHMATSVKTPVLAIFGSTVKEWGFFPFRSHSIVVENKMLDCRPCTHIGRHSCPKKHFKCMMDITPDMVVEKFEKLIST